MGMDVYAYVPKEVNGRTVYDFAPNVFQDLSIVDQESCSFRWTMELRALFKEIFTFMPIDVNNPPFFTADQVKLAH